MGRELRRKEEKKNKSSPHHSPGGGCSCLPVCKQIVNTQKVGSAFFAKICYFGIKDTARPLGGTRKGGADRGKNE